MFGIDVIDAALLPSLLIALLAGVISFLSPCVLPIVPPYLAYMGGISMHDISDGKQSNRFAIIASVFFAMGLSTVLIFLGFTSSLLGQIFLQNQRFFGILSGLVIILFGLHFLGLIRIPFLYREARIDAGDRGGSAFGAYILGLAFAFGWTPCIGPILGAILAVAAQEGSVGRGTMLMAAYALGLGLPFIFTAIFLNKAGGVMNNFKRHMATVERAMGGFLILVGLALAFDFFSRISYWLLELFPFLALVG